MDPLELLIATLYVPGGVAVWVETESVEVAVPPDETVTLDGMSETDSPEDEELADKLTGPENPFIDVMVIIDDPLEPELIDKELGFAAIE